MTDDVGRVLGGRYRLLARIGSGSTTTVFAAEDLELGHRVAVKLFASELAEDGPFLERFVAAAEQLVALQHPNIVAVHDWGCDDEPFLVTDLCEGGSLRDLLGAGRRLTPSQALVVSLESAQALDHAHAHGFVHHNLRPTNVLFSSDQRLRIDDFALALLPSKATAPAEDGSLSEGRYASPEQARDKPVGPASDVYSLALIATEAVSGLPPPVDETVVGMLMARAEAAAELTDGLAGLRGPLERCAQLDPADRPEAGELAGTAVAPHTLANLVSESYDTLK